MRLAGMNKHERLIANLILALQSLNGITNQMLLRLLSQYQMPLAQLTQLSLTAVKQFNDPEITPHLPIVANNWQRIVSKADLILATAKCEEVAVLLPTMKQYPQRLLTMSDFPVVLFAKGNLALLNAVKVVTITGTQHPTSLSDDLTQRLVSEFSSNNCTIATGLMKGSETTSCEEALQTNSQILAVLATAINRSLYPTDNRKLIDQILDNDGVLVSMCPPLTEQDTTKTKQRLLERAKLQAALSTGLVVTETSLNSLASYMIKIMHQSQRPIGMLDYRQTRLKQQFATNSCFAGNRTYLKQPEVTALITPESVTKFIQRLNN